MLAPLLAIVLSAHLQPSGSFPITTFGPSGGDIVEHCRQVVKIMRDEKGNEGDARACLSYLYGFADGGQFGAKGDHKLFPVCFPEGVDGGQMAKIVVKFGDDHPEKLSSGSLYIVFNALRDAFPCSAK